jgi:hypothetical protein
MNDGVNKFRLQLQKGLGLTVGPKRPASKSGTSKFEEF